MVFCLSLVINNKMLPVSYHLAMRLDLCMPTFACRPLPANTTDGVQNTYNRENSRKGCKARLFFRVSKSNHVRTFSTQDRNRDSADKMHCEIRARWIIFSRSCALFVSIPTFRTATLRSYIASQITLKKSYHHQQTALYIMYSS